MVNFVSEIKKKRILSCPVVRMKIFQGYITQKKTGNF